MGEIANKTIKRFYERAEELIAPYNNKVINYEVEKYLMDKLFFTKRKQLIDTFKKHGFFIEWLKGRYNGKGGTIYKVIRKSSYKSPHKVFINGGFQ